MKLLKNIYELLNNVIVSLKSTRTQLAYIAVALFIFTLKKTQDAVIIGLVAGFLSTVYYFYFQSKIKRDQHDHEMNIINSQTKEGNDEELPKP